MPVDRKIKVAIHEDGGWGKKWLEYCRSNQIPHKAVNCYESDILSQIGDCNALMWAFKHLLPTDILMARHVLYTAGKMGIHTYPDFDTAWHFDDKVAQKYLLEAMDLPAARAWVFYSKEKLAVWLEKNPHRLPIVAKLRRGAGSYNVRLMRTHHEVLEYANKMFGKGISPAPSGFADAGNKMRVAYSAGGIKNVFNRLKKAPRFFEVMRQGRKYHSAEKGYVYLQEFIPGNDCDFRLKVVGDRAWGFRRFVRKNDFRASGSGELDFDHRKIPISMVAMAFKTCRKLRMQSLALDIVLERDTPLIVEISYGFGIDQGEAEGYWTADGIRHDSSFDPVHLICETFIKNMDYSAVGPGCRSLMIQDAS